MIAHAIKHWLQALYVLVKKISITVCVCALAFVCVHYAAAQFVIYSHLYGQDSHFHSKISACSLNLAKRTRLHL